MRVGKDMGGQIVHYTYDGKSVLNQSDVDGHTIAKYEYGPDRLLSMEHVSEGRQFYLFDALGSVSNLTNFSGAVQARYQYDAFGNMRAESGSSYNRFTFTGHEKDTETGLYYFKARFYDPDTGRFLNQDPYLGDVNTPPSLHRYLYAYSNPVVYIDLEGYSAIASRGSWCASQFEGECEGAGYSADVDETIQQSAPVENIFDRSDREISENVEKIKRESNATTLVENEAGAGTESPCTLGWGIVGCLTNKAESKVGDVARDIFISMRMAAAGNKAANDAAAIGDDVDAAVDSAREDAERVGDKVKEEATKYSAAAIEAAGGPVLAGTSKAKKVGAVVLKPGSAAHRAQRWLDYKSRNKGNSKAWSYERWSKQYDVNMRNSSGPLLREAEYRLALGADNVVYKTPYGPRQIDAYVGDNKLMVQIKTGKESLTTIASKLGNRSNEMAIKKDAWLVSQGYNVEWVLEKGASQPLLDALTNAGIKYHIGAIIK